MATPNKMKIKEEKDCDDMVNHSHELSVTIGTSKEEWKHCCEKPRTVLEVVKSMKHEELKCPDNEIIIQLGKADKKHIVATHFPCSCVPRGESLIVLPQSKVVETTEEHETTIQSRDKYSVFYIDTVGGLYTKTKQLCRNNAVKDFKYLCVYGEKEWTLEEALKRDGRFIDDLGDFFLSEDENANCKFQCAEKVGVLDGKYFKLCLPKRTVNKRKKLKRRRSSKTSPNRCSTEAVSKAAHQRGVSVTTKVENSSSSHNTDEIYELLCQQFSALKQRMENRFPGNSYQETLNLRKEEFGKIQKLFNEVHRVRKLLKLGESVCKVVVENVSEGTGFVLFDNLILTNAHLFKDCVEGDRLKKGTQVYTLFNYDDPEPHTNYYYFELAQSYICDIHNEIDYAILELKPEGRMLCVPPTPKNKVTIPPGLLKHFGPVPESGEACLIGHPKGGVKNIDPTCIIEIENRKQAAEDEYSNSPVIVHTINQPESKGIDNIMMGGQRADKVSTYKTFMYHGSSGSPVFDAHCRVFGLHTGGFPCEAQQGTQSVIEFAQHLLTIFKHLVCKLRDRRLETLLKRVEEEAEGNSYLKNILASMGGMIESRPELPSGSDGVVKIEPADSEEPMETL